MTQYDRAKYVGRISAYAGKVADIRPHPGTLDEPLSRRKVFVKWVNPKIIHHEHGEAVGSEWHLMPANDFRIIVMAKT